MRVPYTVMPDGDALTQALTAALPGRIGGVVVYLDPPEVQVKVRGADLTPAESAQVQAALAAHDGDAVRAAKAAKSQRKRDERAKDPTKLTDKERLTRIEVILGIEGG